MARRRKGIKIAKGVRLNFNRSGTSLTFSHKNIFGKTKSSTVRLTGGSSHRRSSPKPVQSSLFQTTVRTTYDFNINDDGTVEFFDSKGNRIYDETLIRKMKATDQFRSQKARILAERKAQKQSVFEEEQDNKFREIQGETDDIVNIYKMSANVISQEQCLSAISNIIPREYHKETFSGAVPMKEHAVSILRKEAEESVKVPFWKKKKAIEEYIFLRAEDYYNKELQDYEKRKDDFEQNEIKKESEMNKRYAQEAEEEKDKIRQIMKNDTEFIENSVLSWLRSLTLTVDFDVDFEYDINTKTMILDLTLPVINDIPTEKAVRLSSGTVKSKPKTQKEIKQQYIICVFGLAVFISSHIFNINTSIRNITVSGYVDSRNDQTGQREKVCLYSLKFPREEFEETDLTAVDPQEFCLSMEESRANITASLVMKPVEAFETDARSGE